MAQKATQFPISISALAWSPNGKKIALSAYNSCDIEVYELPNTAGDEWKKTAVLQGHEHPVAALDWDHHEHHLVSCGHDRNAFVWVHESTVAHLTPTHTRHSGDGGGDVRSALHQALADEGYLPCDSPESQGWHKQMVLTRLKRACLCVKWSPCQRKLALGGASRAVTVAFHDPTLRVWAPKSCVGRHRSSITAVAWHPHPKAYLLATGSTDGCVRLLSAHVPEVDGPLHHSTSPFGPAPFGTVLATLAPQPPPSLQPPPSPQSPQASQQAFTPAPFEHDPQHTQTSSTHPWVHSVAWTPEGGSLLWSSHNSTMHSATTPHIVAAVNSARQALQAAGGQGEQDQHQQHHQQQQQQQFMVVPEHSLQLPGSPLKVVAGLGERVVVGAGWDGMLVVMVARRHASQAQQQQGNSSGGGGGGAGRRIWKVAHVLGLNSPDAALASQLASQLTVGGTAGGAAGDAGAGGATNWEAVIAATEPAHTNLVTALVAPLSSRPHTRPMQDTGAQQGEQAPAAAAPQPPQFMTGGLDGRLVVWDVTGLAGVQ